MQWPLKFMVLSEGEGHWEEDRFGNSRWVPGPLTDVPVFGWSVVRTEESTNDGESIMRLIDRLELIAPPGSFVPEASVTLPDGGVWQIEGNPQDHNSNPWWQPGLVIYYAKKVQG